MTESIIEQIGRVFVPTRRVKAAMAELDLVWEHGRGRDNMMAVMILGQPRSGKTRIVKRWAAEKLGLAEYPEGTSIAPSICYVEIEPKCSMRSFCGDVLQALGDPNPDHGSWPAKTRRIVAQVKKQNRQVLILDEMHRLIDADTAKVKQDIGQWITAFLNKRLCSLVLAGEESAERVFEPVPGNHNPNNLQLEGRSYGAFYLTPYDWNNEDDRTEFRAVIHEIEKRLALPEPSRMGAALNIALRIHRFSDGYLGRAARLIAKAYLHSIKKGRPMIGMEELADAVDELRIGSARKLTNPFRV